MLLQATGTAWPALIIWPVVLLGGLGMIIALSRAGTTLFWRGRGAAWTSASIPSSSPPPSACCWVARC